jgi:NADPH-dependent 2,4-dienoyl-CoA reductase/sulfur reductase-like enzyme/peroxiredoxin family protein/rhodanese-related sulfurtransferase/TusA-related sulfurtransferase
MSAFRLIVVGGVAAGASAAARARRLSESAEIIMIERGPHVSFANCGLPYHIGGVIHDRARLLVQTSDVFYKRFRIDTRVNQEVTAIDRGAKTVTVHDRATDRTYTERYDALVLSPGAEPIRPPIPGVDVPGVHTLRTMGDMDAIKAVVDEKAPRRAVVVGGGYIGLEMAEALRARGVDVTLVELAPQVMGTVDPEIAALLHDELLRNGVDLRLNTSVKAFASASDGVQVTLSTGETLACGLVVLAIGVRPDVQLARAAGLTLGQCGGIVVDDHMRTSDPAIYAVGDAIEITDLIGGQPALIPLAGPANRQGRIAADNIFGRDSTYRHTQGTAICKVFELAVGTTGLNEKALRRRQRHYESITIHPANHASYYPGAQMMTLKLLFDPETGAILGAQAVGTAGIDKRLDVLATALRARLTVFDLEHLELCYAPPYGSAKDPVNYAGFVAANVVRGDVQLCHYDDVINPAAHQQILDVSTAEEVAAGAIPNAVNIPLDTLRERLGELDKSKEYLTYCRVGLRGYVACRILKQHGFACRNLSGGYLTYRAAVPHVPPDEPPRRPAATDTGSEVRAPVVTAPVPDASAAAPAVTIDACGLQCPGPILRVKTALDGLQAGQVVKVLSTDAGFTKDIAGWCASVGHRLVSLTTEQKTHVAFIEKCAPPATTAAAGAAPISKNTTLVVFSGDYDKAMAAFIIANGAAATGAAVTMFFTFWGLNILRRPESVPVKKDLLERMFGWMMPRGATRLGLSKMNMSGLGAAMIRFVMRRKRVAPLPELIASARQAGVKLVACTMSMDVMGIKREELIDGLEEAGVASYLHAAQQGTVNLFI